MQYLAWRVLVGLNQSITISFLLVGHTKFAPDWCFGLLKQRFRKSKVDCLDDIAQVVQSSAVVNEVQLVATQDGDVIVPTYDWAGHFNDHYHQSALKGIKKFHHFCFDQSHPGDVFVQTFSGEPETKLTLLQDTTWSPSLSDLPLIIPPAGLSAERQIYLYEKIREYCRPEVRDLVCPRPRDYAERPHAPLPSVPLPLPEEAQRESAPLRKRRKCSECHQTGHNKRSCPRLRL